MDKTHSELAEELEETILDSGERMLKYFRFSHLGHLQSDSAPFAQLALIMLARHAASPERTVMFRKLLEAKDCSVRCAVDAK
jgi:hypothetical protein